MRKHFKVGMMPNRVDLEELETEPGMGLGLSGNSKWNLLIHILAHLLLEDTNNTWVYGFYTIKKVHHGAGEIV